RVTPPPGLAVTCHAAESSLTRPSDRRERPATPDDRPPYQGANPVADVWSAKALQYGGEFLRRAVADGDDVEARGAMMLAATMAGGGFGSAGGATPPPRAGPLPRLQHPPPPPPPPPSPKYCPPRRTGGPPPPP